jgi:hypothetical protein
VELFGSSRKLACGGRGAAIPCLDSKNIVDVKMNARSDVNHEHDRIRSREYPRIFIVAMQGIETCRAEGYVLKSYPRLGGPQHVLAS